MHPGNPYQQPSMGGSQFATQQQMPPSQQPQQQQQPGGGGGGSSGVRKATLLTKLGGPDTLRIVVKRFYARITKDPKLQPYFLGVNIKLLKWHQYNFMSIAFTSIPDGLDVGLLIMRTHRRLFDMGLDENHFDMVAGHFVATLREMGVQPATVDEAAGVILPLRPIFVKGAIEARAKKKERYIKWAASAATVLLLYLIWYTTNVWGCSCSCSRR